jgi:YVTN family beta-propeller protein
VQALSRRAVVLVAVSVLAVAVSALRAAHAASQRARTAEAEQLPTGLSITPTAARGAKFQTLNPELPKYPTFRAGQAVTTTISPDGKTLLILTSGYNLLNDAEGRRDPAGSNEYVFVYDISGAQPVKRQVLQVPNTFDGIAWSPRGDEFYVSGGRDDAVHVFGLANGRWERRGAPIPLGHTKGLGINVKPVAAGVAVNAAGTQLVVANFENDTISVIDLRERKVTTELDLRPGKLDPSQVGVAGGEYPLWVVIQGDSKAYVSSPRDREIVVVELAPTPRVAKRIAVSGPPNRMLLDRKQARLFVALGNRDAVAVIDTATLLITEEIRTAAPKTGFPNMARLPGSNPNSLALSPDERTLYVTNGGSNSVAVIRLSRDPGRAPSEVLGLIPTGWYPDSVSVSADGATLYVVNGKSNAGPNPKACRATTATARGSDTPCRAANQYIWQLTKAGFLNLPTPTSEELKDLTAQVARNNHMSRATPSAEKQKVVAFLRGKIKHVIYILKENRTYDQVLGDLEKGNGDPALALLGDHLSPNHHRLARQFVILDNFYDSGEVSGDGWNWSTAARTSEMLEKTVAVEYASRGLPYDFEGTNRLINVGFATLRDRRAANPETPDDPDLLPGLADLAAVDSPAGEANAGYLWDAALRAGLTVRNYGFYLDLRRYDLPKENPLAIPLVRDARAEGVVVAIPTKAALRGITDPYFRGFDQKFPDYWRYKEWEHEFDEYVKNGNLPNLELVRLPHDHFGDFGAGIDGVTTVETEMADNDYAVGLLVEKVAHSRYKDDTLIFILEDDAQNGADHVDAHRSIAFVAGPYVRQGVVVSKRYTTVHALRTMEDVLGIEYLGLNDALAEPMTEVFQTERSEWIYSAVVPEALRTTQLPLPARAGGEKGSAATPCTESIGARPLRDAAYWAEKMRGLDFEVEDRLDTARFNLALWEGLKGEGVPYPKLRSRRNLRLNRERLLERFRLATSLAGAGAPATCRN